MSKRSRSQTDDPEIEENAIELPSLLEARYLREKAEKAKYRHNRTAIVARIREGLLRDREEYLESGERSPIWAYVPYTGDEKDKKIVKAVCKDLANGGWNVIKDSTGRDWLIAEPGYSASYDSFNGGLRWEKDAPNM
jgi:hypothetical protein